MLDDILEIAADLFLDISEWKSISPRTKRILQGVGLLLGLASIVVFFVLN